MKNKEKSKKIRIISGIWKGLKIDVIDTEDMQPTPDRVRETLFNWLQNKIYHADCLDLFGGSGILSLESLSRGANSATYLENNKKHIDSLIKNSSRLKPEKLEIIKSNTLEWLDNCQKNYDIIYLDPPYESNFYNLVLEKIFNKNILKPNGIIYVESNKPLDNIISNENFKIQKSSTAGKIYYGIVSQV